MPYVALVGYIAVAVAIIIAIVIINLIRGTDKTSAIPAARTCPVCGRKRGLLRCAYCQPEQGPSFDV